MRKKLAIVKNKIDNGNTTLLKSFNEAGVEVTFDKEQHSYHHVDTKLQGATDYLKQFYKSFPLEAIAKKCAASWGVSEQDITDIWDTNSKLTSSFGTVIHNALDYYEKYKDIGKTIQESRGDEYNYALPKHPFLRSIILDFIEINKVQGKVYTEVLITNIEKGICGQGDRLTMVDEENKVCRVGDYKINVDCEEISKSQKVLPPLEALPSNKLSKYQIQLSIYANMLQLSGWTVEALDVYVYENGWKYYQLEVLNILN